MQRDLQQEAMEMVEEYKNELSPQLYNETKKQVEEANLDDNTNETPKTRRVIRKNV